MMKAAEDLKQQQLMKEQERQRILSERIVKLPDVDGINDTSKYYLIIFYLKIIMFSIHFVDQLMKIAKEIWDRLGKVEEEKYDLEYSVRQKDFEINELTIAVNDLRGKLYVHFSF
jgi:hypothetical protein